MGARVKPNDLLPVFNQSKSTAEAAAAMWEAWAAQHNQSVKTNQRAKRRDGERKSRS